MKNGRLVALTAASLVVLYFVLAALHDISRGGESDYTLEYAALALCIPALALLYRQTFRYLERSGKVTWLAVTGGLLLLFNVSAVSAWLHPKYANDAAVGAAFLAAGLPLLAFDLIRLLKLTTAPR